MTWHSLLSCRKPLLGNVVPRFASPHCSSPRYLNNLESTEKQGCGRRRLGKPALPSVTNSARYRSPFPCRFSLWGRRLYHQKARLALTTVEPRPPTVADSMQVDAGCSAQRGGSSASYFDLTDVLCLSSLSKTRVRATMNNSDDSPDNKTHGKHRISAHPSFDGERAGEQ